MSSLGFKARVNPPWQHSYLMHMLAHVYRHWWKLNLGLRNFDLTPLIFQANMISVRSER